MSLQLLLVLAASSLPLVPCAVRGASERARCGELLVPENRADPGARTIKLHIMVLDAVERGPKAEAIFDLAGGPGAPATLGAGFWASDGKKFRAHRDVVLVDQRGTGESSPLRCPQIEFVGPFDEMFPTEPVARCRQALSQQADLTQYTTAASARDLEDVRRSLGYGSVDLTAASYGTRLAQEYIRLFPKSVRAALFMGTLPMTRRVPLDHARNAQAVLDKLFDECAADAACATAFPHLRDDWAKLLARLDGDGVTIHGPRGLPITVRRGPFTEAIRFKLYASDAQRQLPYIIHAAALDDFGAFTEAGGPPTGAIAEGLYLAVTCTEDVSRIADGELDAATAGTFGGRYRIDEQRSACRDWPQPKFPDDAFTPVVSDVPVLMLAGGMDPVTPAAWANEVAVTLPQARVVVIDAMSHEPGGVDHMECYDKMTAELLDTGRADRVDSSCVSGMKALPFRVLAEPSHKP